MQEPSLVNSTEHKHSLSPEVAEPWEYSILRDWILSYIAFSRVSPAFPERLGTAPGEFKYVPIPRELYSLLERHSLEHASLEADSVGESAGPDTSTIRWEIADALSRFSKNLEEGNLPVLLEVISREYRDLMGRDRSGIGKDIERLIRDTEDRRLNITDIAALEVIGKKIRARVGGQWNAVAGNVQGAQGEQFNLEVIFHCDETMTWKICSMDLC
jgi:hypothetical protein